MLARRSIDTKYFYMDKNQDKEVYALNIIQKNNVKSCLLVEGPIDCLTCWSHGIPAIAMLGTPSDYQIENINKSCLTSIYIATDNDDAGKKFANDLDKKLNKRILRTRVDLPKTVKDVNDLSDEEWNNLIFKYNLTKY
ncbi:MAG: toprim domain-containing protein, partial [Bacilli bacterium]|nr:toprim domain-containing protein [Bacilli bacterium]